MALLLGQWFGSGLSPRAPGTVGSLATLPLFLVLRMTPGAVYWGATLTIALGGIWVSGRCSKLLSEEDPSSVVIDEVAGVLISLGLVRSAEPIVLVGVWLLFRLLDIKKPWLIDRAQNLRPAGLGIMADDILAGGVAGLLGLATVSLIPLL